MTPKDILNGLISHIDQIDTDQIETAKQILRNTPGKLIFLGNGGSNAVCSHMAEDYTNNFKPSQCFSDTAFLSCFANDFGWEVAFRKWLENFALPGDTIILISSSGASKNILNCAHWARDNKFPLITLSGFKPENPLRETGDVNFYVASTSYGHVEIAHLVILHTILDSLMYENKKVLP